MQLRQSLKRRGGPGFILIALSRIEANRGNFEKAKSHLEENIATAKQLGHRRNYLWNRAHLGQILLSQGEIREAQHIFFETVQEFYSEKSEIGVVFTLEGVVRLYAAVEKAEIAARLIGWVDATRERIGDTRMPIEQAIMDQEISSIIEKIGQEAFLAAYVLGKTMTIEEVFAFVSEYPQI
jgi:hypothetical protein